VQTYRVRKVNAIFLTVNFASRIIAASVRKVRVQREGVREWAQEQYWPFSTAPLY
jgi:hypothetical protein